MGSLRTFFGILILSAIAYGVYVSIATNPKSGSRLDTAPQWGASDAGFPQNGAPPFAANPPPISATPSFPPPIAPGGLTGTSPNPADAFGPPKITLGTPATGSGTSPATPPSITLNIPANPAPPSITTTVPAGPTPPSQQATPTPITPPPGGATPTVSLPPSGAIATNPIPSPATPAAPTETGVRADFIALMQLARSSLDSGRIEPAHKALSQLYGDRRLSPEEAKQLNTLLDQTAGTLIYAAKQHVLEPAYHVQAGDSLERIGQTYGVSGELLGKINGLRPPQLPPTGMELKVIRGPFNALVSLERYEMAIFLGGQYDGHVFHDGLYAGRFPIGIGHDHPPQEGTFSVRQKRINALQPGLPVDPTDPVYASGKRAIDLGNQIAIHAADSPRSLGNPQGRGSIGLSDRDLDDVYDILSVGSTVVVRR